MSWAARHPGRLATQLLQLMEDTVGRDGEARSWDKDDVPASAKSYFIHVLRPTTEKTSSLRDVREMHTLAVILDHLALGRSGAAADVVAQRLKALELASTSGSWEKAQYLEIVPPEGASLVNKEEEYLATKETELHQRLHGRSKGSSFEPDWNNYGGKTKNGKGKNKDKDRKGKGQERAKDQGASAPSRGLVV